MGVPKEGGESEGGKRGIATTTTGKRTPPDILREFPDVNSKQSFFSRTQTGSQVKYEGKGIGRKVEREELDGWKGERVSRMLLMDEVVQQKPSVLVEGIEQRFIDRLFVDRDGDKIFQNQNFCTPIKQSQPLGKLRTSTILPLDSALQSPPPKSTLSEKSFAFLPPHSQPNVHHHHNDAFRNFQNQYGFASEMQKEKERELRSKQIIRLNGRAKSQRKKEGVVLL